MGLIAKLKGEVDSGSEFVDLTTFKSDAEHGTTCWIKVAEVTRFDDVLELADPIYAGNVILLDIKAIAADEFLMRRITNELRRMVGDVGGDLAGVGETLLAVTPAGIRVDRTKMRFNA